MAQGKFTTSPTPSNIVSAVNAMVDDIAGKAASSHNHSAANITSGTLAVARGGTGVTANPSMLTNLGSTSAASVFAASPRPGITGTLSVANGGTGATTAAQARANLGLDTGLAPTGTIIAFAGSSIPSGYLDCNGSAISRTTYSALYSAIGTTYGSGDGSTTFNLPNIPGKIVTDVSVSGSVLGNGKALRLTDKSYNYLPVDYRWSGEKGIGLSVNGNSVNIGTTSGVSKADYGQRAIGLATSGDTGLKLNATSTLTSVNVTYIIKY